jgi:hypothetical protein
MPVRIAGPGGPAGFIPVIVVWVAIGPDLA